jgi:predicted regulator of Ras-like GTPase activity (Roadblock/LC7/MglB family)
MGQTLPREAQQLDIQGTLAKPFFADDLLPTIREALSRQVEPPAPRPVTAPKSAQPSMRVTAQLRSELSQLAHEVNADTVLLLSTGGAATQIVAEISSLDKLELETLSDLIASTVHSAQETAHFLGQRHQPFEHNMFEGQELRLYIMVVREDLILAVTTPTSTALGTLRHNLRHTVRTLTHLGHT